MATQQQMVPTVREITTKSGQVFKLVRPTLALRMATVDFISVVVGLEERADMTAVREVCDAFLGLLVNWLSRTYPGITREEIAEAFDMDDISAIMEVINGFEQEVAAVIPPASRAGRARKN
ncbi:MAG: hypothetical protein ACYC2Y_10960 [Armatimonadota bacterium]